MEKETILIVEDDAILAVHLRNMLIGLGYSVPEPVATGEAAIAAVAAERPDLILMDIQLAGVMDGITASGHIRSAADVPIVFLTGYSQDPLLQRAKTTAPYGYLLKPVSQPELAATIEMALYRHRIDRQLKEHKEALEKAQDELEWRVQERTADLLSANKKLSREIDERRRVEATLRESEERLFNSMATLTMVIDGISDPLILLDAELRVKRLNRAAKDYYRLTSYQEAAGKLCFDAFRGRSSPCEGCEHPFSDMRGYFGT